ISRKRKRHPHLTVAPSLARFLVYLFLPGRDGQAIFGDLEEQFGQIARDRTLGPRYAKCWYWFQVLISLSPLIWERVKPVLKAFGGISALGAIGEFVKTFVK